jgi:hypothetical protein
MLKHEYGGGGDGNGDDDGVSAKSAERSGLSASRRRLGAGAHLTDNGVIVGGEPRISELPGLVTAGVIDASVTLPSASADFFDADGVGDDDDDDDDDVGDATTTSAAATTAAAAAAEARVWSRITLLLRDKGYQSSSDAVGHGQGDELLSMLARLLPRSTVSTE